MVIGLCAKEGIPRDNDERMAYCQEILEKGLMLGMMDTILNLGLNDNSVVGLAEATQNERFAYDSYRRFIQMFSD
ncbi:hypothetical protein, partial [Clostridioides difficile]|uniref:hypothetical protein n=1 Tax=Clostridioides difficile TaxID=1496 RepID=UPI002ED64825